jgi:hypothetical protein
MFGRRNCADRWTDKARMTGAIGAEPAAFSGRTSMPLASGGSVTRGGVGTFRATCFGLPDDPV